jgi:hypothetical protein
MTDKLFNVYFERVEFQNISFLFYFLLQYLQESNIFSIGLLIRTQIFQYTCSSRLYSTELFIFIEFIEYESSRASLIPLPILEEQIRYNLS